MRVFISGGGIAGLTLALKLLQHNIDVLVVEKNKVPSTKYKGELLQPKSLDILKDLGVIDQVLKYGKKISRTIIKELDINKQAEWDYSILDHEFNYAWMIPHEKLKEILLEACLQLNPSFYRKGVKFLSLEPTEGDLKEEALIEKSGQTERVSSDIFIGAEGRISPVQKDLGIARRKKKYNHQFLTVTFPKPPNLKEATIVAKEDQLLGVFPLANDLVRTILLIKPGEYKQMIQSGLETFYKKYTDLMPLMDGYVHQIDSYKSIQLMIPVGFHAESYVKGNAALIGDAAHSVHPMAGEGMNLAIQDADILGELLAWMNQHDYEKPELLRWFEKVRRPRAAHVSDISHQSALVYSYNSKPWRRFRIQVLQRIQQNKRLHFKQMLNISGLGEWEETLTDRFAQAGILKPKRLTNNFNQADYFYTKKDDYPWK